MSNLFRNTLCLGVSLGLAGISQGALVGHWTFDEASSGDATSTLILDSSGYTHNGVAYGGVTYTSGHLGAGALSFDGSTGYVQIPTAHGTALDMAGSQYTIAWWSKIHDDNGLQVVIGNDDGWDYSDGVLVYYSSNTLYVAQNSHNGTTQTQSTGYSPSNPNFNDLDQWVHFALTYDGNGQIRNVYRNGQLLAYFTTTLDAGTNLSTDLYFGRYTINSSGYYNGALDDVRIYDTALSASEISQIMNNVPEPSSALVLIAGLGLASGRRKRMS